MKRSAALCLLGVVLACAPDAQEEENGEKDPGWTLPNRDLCPDGAYDEPEALGLLEDSRLVEISGLAASLRSPGLLWGHNDSGDEARLYAFSDEGAAVGEVMLSGVNAVDFEDMEAALCPPGMAGENSADAHSACLWIADTGDNDVQRNDAALWVVLEPPWAVGQSHPPLELEAQHFPITFEGGPVNVEALAIAPDLSGIFFFEKVDGAAPRIFSLAMPLLVGEANLAQVLTTIEAPGVDVPRGKMITGATFHLSGERFLLRVYTGVFEYALGQPNVLAGVENLVPTFSVVGPLAERQGEAVTYDHDGTGIFTASEDPEKTTPGAIHHARCASP
jgi:hypothetical protein